MPKERGWVRYCLNAAMNSLRTLEAIFRLSGSHLYDLLLDSSLRATRPWPGRLGVRERTDLRPHGGGEPG